MVVVGVGDEVAPWKKYAGLKSLVEYPVFFVGVLFAVVSGWCAPMRTVFRFQLVQSRHARKTQLRRPTLRTVGLLV